MRAAATGVARVAESRDAVRRDGACSRASFAESALVALRAEKDILLELLGEKSERIDELSVRERAHTLGCYWAWTHAPYIDVVTATGGHR